MAGPVSIVQGAVPSDYRLSGPIAGVIAAQQIADQQAAQTRDFRNNDLTYQSDLNKYNNDMLDNPVLAAKRSLDMASASEDQSLHDSGLIMQKKTAEVDAKIQEQLSNKTLGQIKDMQSRLDWAAKAGQQLDYQNDDNPVVHAQNAASYEAIRAQAKVVGADKGLPDVWGPQAMAEMQRRQRSAEYSIPHVQKMAEEKLKADSQEKIHAAMNVSAEKRAQMMSDVTRENKENALPIERKIKNDIAKQTYVTPEQLNILETVWDKEYRPQVAKEAESAFGNKAIEFDSKSDADKAALRQKFGLPKDADGSDYKKVFVEAYKEKAKKEFLANYTEGKPVVKTGKSPVSPQAPTKLTPEYVMKHGQKQPDGSYILNGKRYTPPKANPSPSGVSGGTSGGGSFPQISVGSDVGPGAGG